jgi:hypothetical protein
MTDLNNPYHGYRNQEEMETYILLKNYFQSSLSARKLLPQIMFKALKDLAVSKSFEFEGQQFSYMDKEIPSILNMIQVDIIAKIMMYIEDLVTLLIAIRDCNGNYYRLLDRTSEQDLDLGGRISEFLKNIDTFASDQWRTMLGYATPDEFATEYPAVSKLIS